MGAAGFVRLRGAPLASARLVGVYQRDALAQHDGPQQSEASKQGGQRDGLGEGQAWCVVHLLRWQGARQGGTAVRMAQGGLLL